MAIPEYRSSHALLQFSVIIFVLSFFICDFTACSFSVLLAIYFETKFCEIHNYKQGCSICSLVYLILWRYSEIQVFWKSGMQEMFMKLFT